MPPGSVTVPAGVRYAVALARTPDWIVRGLSPVVIEIPGYYLKRTIGSGGMATVYLAVQESLEREVALKVMSPNLSADEAFAARFQREARTIAKLSHPNIVQIFDVGTTPDNHNYFAMQYLPGGTLKDRLGRRMNEMEVFRIFAGVLKALGFAHELGFVHRDVKPENILFDVTGTPILTDFGIARAVRSVTRITETGMSIGTSKYMSPEQARGGNVDARSDLYAMGVVLYEAVTGTPPFEAEDTFAVAYAHVNEPVPPVPARLRVWEPVLMRALAKNPRERFPSAEAFVAAIERVARQGGAEGVADRTGITRIFTGSGRGGRRPWWRFWRRKVKTEPTEQIRTPLAIPSAFSRRLLARLRPWLPTFLRRPVWRLVQLLDEAATGMGRRWRSARRHRRQHPGTYIAGGLVLVVAALLAAWLSVRPLDSGESAPADGAAGTQPADSVSGPPRAPVEGADAGGAAVQDTRPDAGGDAQSPPRTPVTPPLDAGGRDTVEALLEKARRALAANRLTTPAGDNALSHLERVLAREPENPAARAGVRSIVQRYLELSARARLENAPERAGMFLLRARQVLESHEINSDAAARVATEADAVYQGLVAAGRHTLEQGDRELARELLSQAMRLQPEAEEARVALDALDQTPGRAQLRDPLSAGGEGPAMVAVPAGSFEFGGGDAGTVSVAVERPFAMSRHEITVEQYRRFAEHSGYDAAAHGCEVYENRWQFYQQFNWTSPGFPQNPDYPVVCVSWSDAQAYVAWLSVQSGKSYRLPTEAEWEYALVTGSDLEREVCELGNVGDIWLKGRFPREEAFDCADGAYFTTSVASWPPDDYGLHDMVGNVREWALDCWNDTHRGRPQTQAARLSGNCGARVIKGSSWLTGRPGIAPWHRVRAGVDDAYNAVGFRVVRELDGQR